MGKATILEPQAAKEKVGGFLGGFDVFGLVEGRAGAGHGVDHETVPCGDDFVVATGADSLFARGEQLGAALSKFGLQISLVAIENFCALFESLRQVENVAVFE